eukprot:scaffold90524_cov23-Tisochrysis_lutea.AAC.1
MQPRVLPSVSLLWLLPEMVRPQALHRRTGEKQGSALMGGPRLWSASTVLCAATLHGLACAAQ